MEIYEIKKPVNGYLLFFEKFATIIDRKYLPIIIDYSVKYMNSEYVEIRLARYERYELGRFRMNDFDQAIVEFCYSTKDGNEKIILPIFPESVMVSSRDLNDYSQKVKISWLVAKLQ